MVRGSQGTRFTGSALVRLLARLIDASPPEPKQTVAERLSRWLDWTDAISLSAALDGGQAGTPSRGQRAPSSAQAEEQELIRVRSALADAVAASGHMNEPPMDTDFSPYRRDYVARQQAMETAIGALRNRVRSAVANASPNLARLAALDAIMERVLGARERTLLSTLPALLAKHHARMQQLHQATPADAQAPDEPGRLLPEGGWQAVFLKDMQAVQLAELHLRLQPVEGLLAALRASEPMPT